MNKQKNKKIRDSIIIGTLIIGIFIFSIILADLQNNTVFTNTETISNKKIGWGIKRNDNHEQPDVGEDNKKVLEENNGITLGNEEKKYIYLTFDEGYEARIYIKYIGDLEKK